MHNNFYFIRQISNDLSICLSGYKLVECFSQQKDELVLIFENQQQDYFIIQAYLGSNFSCLYFPDKFNRARLNSKDYFKECINRVVLKVEQAENDRTFIIHFQGEYSIMFKLHGNRSNLVFFKNKRQEQLFKKTLKNDYNLTVENIHRPANFSFEEFKEKGLKKTFFTFGPVVEAILEEKFAEAGSAEEKYGQCLIVLKTLENPSFFVTNYKDKIILSLLEVGQILQKFENPIAACNEFYHAHFKYNFIQEQKKLLFNRINQDIASSTEYIKKCRNRLRELSKTEAPEKIADVIMANLHAIPPGAQKVVLFNFYTNDQLEVKLKKDFSPQKYAELLYQKGKSRPREIQKLEELIKDRESLINESKQLLELVSLTSNYKDLSPLVKKYLAAKDEKKTEATERFKNFEVMGFQVFIGRNAGNNDELTMKFAHKNDLWLHARDVVGAHVIIKHQAGKNFPKPVIEKAAAVAAFYSERKNDSLCPVMYTEKKYVRKVKGAPKGAVRVEKEKVIMVVPKDYQS